MGEPRPGAGMALRYECKTCGAVRRDASPCRVCGSPQLRAVSVRLEPRGDGAEAPSHGSPQADA
jgi:hypothetical protein